MRNAPPPLEVVFPNGVPEGIKASVNRQHPDGVTEDIRPGNGPLYLDMMRKEIIEREEQL